MGAIRKVIRIDEERCNGCGLCVPACAEGALQVIDGKARLVSEVYCDGLGACLGECPEGAITIEEREAELFDEEAVRQHLAEQVVQHVAHANPGLKTERASHPPAVAPMCPSARMMRLDPKERVATGRREAAGPTASALSHWPIKLKLVPPGAPFLKEADLMLIADCVPFAYPDLHLDFLPEHPVVIGCPKFDDLDFAVSRLTGILKHSDVRSLTVVHMEVPCCFGFWHLGQQALAASGKDIPLRQVIIGVRGEVKSRS